MSRFLAYKYLVPLALLLGLAPFRPQPHLTEKLQMLLAGTLTRPVDIFDLVWHVWPVLLLGYKIGCDLARRFHPERG